MALAWGGVKFSQQTLPSASHPSPSLPSYPPAVGACLGTPPLTVFVESASGIREGARTGVASLMVSWSGDRFECECGSQVSPT